MLDAVVENDGRVYAALKHYNQSFLKILRWRVLVPQQIHDIVLQRSYSLDTQRIVSARQIIQQRENIVTRQITAASDRPKSIVPRLVAVSARGILTTDDCDGARSGGDIMMPNRLWPVRDRLYAHPCLRQRICHARRR